jgi:hypothetical protein
MDKFKIIIFFIFIAFLLALGWYAKAGKMYNQEDPALNTEIQNIYSEMGKIGQIKWSTVSASPLNAYSVSESDIWSGTSYTIQSPKCDLFIVASLNLLGYQTGSITGASSWITDGSNTHLSANSIAQWTNWTTGPSAYYSNVTCFGTKSDLTKGQTITLKIRGQADIANRARLQNVEMYIFEIPKN